MLDGLLFRRFFFKCRREYLWFFQVKGYWVYCYVYDGLKDIKFIVFNKYFCNNK